MKYNWEAISAIGSWFGGMATFLAVVVALWQTKLASKKSLKLSFNRSFTFNGFGETMDCISISIMNTGNRNITIEEFGFKMDNDSSLVVMENSIIQNGAKLPTVLEPDSAIDFHVPLVSFVNSFINAIKQGILDENGKIKIYVRDSFSKRYYHKTKFYVKDCLQPVR